MNIRPKNIDSGYMILLTVLFIAITLSVILGATAPVMARYASARGLLYSKQSYMVAQSAVEDAIYRLKTGLNMPNSSTLTLSSGSATIKVSDTASGKNIAVSAADQSYDRNIQADIQFGTGVSFHYGIQSGNGGFSLANSSSVTGNVFSDGTITGSGNTIAGDVISAGPGGLISNINATGTAYAHTIEKSTAGKNAYYQTIDTSTKVNGSVCPNANCFPDSPDQSPAPLPISDDQISQWENDAAKGGTAVCTNGTYTVSSSATLGPIEIPCNLSVTNSAQLTVTGPIWVQGNISFSNSSKVSISPSLGSQNVAVIADNPSDELNSSKISVSNSVTFSGSGSPNSFMFLISQNRSAENGGSTPAISLSNSATAFVAYAAHGLVPIGNSIKLKEVTAYQISLSNSAAVTYDTGLANTLFQAGPGGGYNIIDWVEY
ncbi:MAG: hypothetical protein KGI49_01545 [Patescibacteria group bacterium]|nr:hypothetical protein [Patescibacteria group bacterium]